MTDKIISPDDSRWDRSPSKKGETKYRHLLDGNARELNIHDYGYDNVEHFRIAITNTARLNGLMSRSRKINDHTLLFQVTGVRNVGTHNPSK